VENVFQSSGRIMKIIGLDMSLACSGVAVVRGGTVTLHTVKSDPDKRLPDAVRFSNICDGIFKITELAADDIVFIEQYAYGANGQITRIAELGGILRYRMFIERGLGYERLFEVSPSTLKKFITGKGNVPKAIVVKELFKRYGFDTNDDNEADACTLALIGKALTYEDITKLPKYQIEAAKAALDRNKVGYERYCKLVQTATSTAGPVPVPAAPAPARRRPAALQATSGPATGTSTPTSTTNAADGRVVNPANLFARRRLPT
jgi:crossover junction endodeoxyribonuclease RuvC